MATQRKVPTAAAARAALRTTQAALPAAVRQQRIVELVRRDGYVRVATLAEHFGISQMSARRDLDALSEQGLIQRSQGAAVAVPANALGGGLPAVGEAEMREQQYETRRRRQIMAKQTIARSAAALLSPEDNIALDVGSTALTLARELAKHAGIHVFTNHLRVASLLAGSRCVVLMPGGIVRAQELSVCGQQAVDDASGRWFSKVFIGVAGLTEDGGFDSSPEDTQVKRAYIEHADQVILLCDASKFGKRSLVQACALSEIDILITDAPPPKALASALAAASVRVVVAV
ncbi:MAG: Glycerol-3-phosphate regulon repressor [Pseudomonadota bacterium]|jgi:DeoR family glycerol-3-phosphate regulon repressor